MPSCIFFFFTLCLLGLSFLFKNIYKPQEQNTMTRVIGNRIRTMYILKPDLICMFCSSINFLTANALLLLLSLLLLLVLPLLLLILLMLLDP